MTLVIEEKNNEPDTTQVQFVLFDDKGEIHQTGHVPRHSLLMQERDGLSVIEGLADHRLDYIKDGVITKRPESPVIIAGGRLCNLPVPCSILINNTIYECSDSYCDIEFTHTGEYRIEVIAFPYLNAKFKVSK